LAGVEQKSECNISTTVDEFVTNRQTKCKMLRSSDWWFGLTYREDRPTIVLIIRKLIALGDYPEKLWT
jgi:hypothetical protein